MSDGYHVNVEQLRTHAGNVEAIRARFGAVKAASAHIAQDDRAYGLLCGWISAILEGRHSTQDDLFAYVEENLSLVVEGLRGSASDYTAADEANANLLRSVHGGPE